MLWKLSPSAARKWGNERPEGTIRVHIFLNFGVSDSPRLANQGFPGIPVMA
jgi:hypothetical protein